MRVEASVPDFRGRQLAEVADQLGLSKSQLIDEALSVYLTALMEARRGLRMALIEPGTQKAVRELVTPALSQLEWAAHREAVLLSKDEFDRVVALLDNPPAAPDALKSLMTTSPREKLQALVATRQDR